MEKLKKFLSKRGSQTALAKSIGAQISDVNAWCNGRRKIPPHFCKPIEEFTHGELTVKDLRPKDWMRYWPDS